MKEGSENRKGFKVPEGYFESLDRKMTSSLNEGSRKGFKVPEGYFEDFAVEFKSLPKSKQESGSGRVIKLNFPEFKKWVWMAAAASVLLFFGVKYMGSDENALDWDDLEQAEMRSWIESDLAELNAYDIAESYPEVDLDGSYLSNEELNAYLNEIELDQILYEN